MQALLCKNSLNCKGKLISLAKPVLMGILNATPDSFFKTSRVLAEPALLAQVERMLKEGATLIDIGGQSTRPGADTIATDEELKRVIPVIKLIHHNFPEAIISIDTFNAIVARASVETGASVINDVSAGEGDEQMFETVAALKVPYIIMHKKGEPLTMQHNPQYSNIVTDLLHYFTDKVTQLQHLNISDIIIDPGFGFGKNISHNYDLMINLDSFKIFELPVIVGISRKSMVQKLLKVNTTDALNGTTALHMAALQNGARILRVHDVKEARQCIKIGEALGWY